MGSCVNAPMIAVADYTKGSDGFTYIYYEDLSPKDAVSILEDLKAGKTPRVTPCFVSPCNVDSHFRHTCSPGSILAITDMIGIGALYADSTATV